MFSDRMVFAQNQGGPIWDDTARVVVFNAQSPEQLAGLNGHITVVQGFYPFVQQLRHAQIQVVQSVSECFDMAVVLIPQSKALARDYLFHASKYVPNGIVIVDGQKGAGIDSILKDLRKSVDLSAAISKAHGKIAWFEGGADLAHYQDQGQQLPSGMRTAAGVFSADAVDPASEILAARLPQLKGRGADLGAGWGYLSHQLTNHADVKEIFAVEADFAAHTVAQNNAPDARIHHIWGDATVWKAPKPLDFVIMNPPFHNAGVGDPAIGQAFIASAAANLSPSGQLYMVANRHLPYELTLDTLFQSVQELDGTSKFKIYHAARPKRRKS